MADQERIAKLLRDFAMAKEAVVSEFQRCCGHEDGETDPVVLQKLSRVLNPGDLPVKCLRPYRASGGGSSLSSSVDHLARLKQALQEIGVKGLAAGGNPKLKDRSFAEALGIPVPRVYLECSLEEVETIPGTIVKPVSGNSANGVFHVDGQLTVRSLKSGKAYATIQAAIEAELTRAGAGSRGRWIVEQAITDDLGRPARDLKVYAFYGECGLFIEIARPPGEGEGQVRKCAHDRDGNPIKLGFRGPELTPMRVPDEAREYAGRISLASPVPFLRVDFLRSADGLYLGEITPHPGTIYRGGSDRTEEADRELGRMFVQAEARLYRDFLRGKRFDTYREIYGASW